MLPSQPLRSDSARVPTNLTLRMQGAVTSLEGFPRATTDDTIQAVACQISRLDSINLFFCENIKNVGVVALAKGCLGLTNITWAVVTT